MLRVQYEPELHSPVLLCAFTGWSDAAFVGSAALQFLVSKFQGQVFADFDPDDVYNYTITRPLTNFNDSHQRVLRWPELRWIAVHLSNEPHDLVLFTGPEPDLKWHGCLAEARELALRLGVTHSVALGGFYGPVPHGGTPTMIGLSANADLRVRLTVQGVGETFYEGPTGFLTILTDALHKAGIPSAAVLTAAPSYLPGTGNPKLSAALLAVVERLVDLQFGLGDLEEAGRQMEHQIDEALRSRPDLAEFVRRLSGASRPQPPISQPAESPPDIPQPSPESEVQDSEELPGAEEVLHDLEEYLRKHRPGDR